MFFSLFLVFFIVIKNSQQQQCQSEMSEKELREFVIQQESIASLPAGRMVLQLMTRKDQYDKSDLSETSKQVSLHLSQTILSYRQQMRKMLNHFIDGYDIERLLTPQIIRLSLFLLEKDCELWASIKSPKEKKKLNENIQLYYSQSVQSKEASRNLLLKIITIAREYHRNLKRTFTEL